MLQYRQNFKHAMPGGEVVTGFVRSLPYKTQRQHILNILEAVSDGVFLLNASFELAYVNTSVERMANKTSSELIGRTIWDIFPELLYANFHIEYYRAVQDRVSISLDMPGLFNGRFYEIHAYPLDTWTVVILIDNTDRKAMETEIEKSRQEAAELLDSITDGFLGVRTDWTIHYINREAEQFYDISRDEVVGRNFWDKFPYIEPNASLLIKAMEKKEAVHFEARSVRKQDCWLDLHVYPSREGIAVFFRDITNRKSMEIKLRQREQEFSTLVQNSPDMIVRYDNNLRHLYVNPQFESATGLCANAILGKTLEEAEYAADSLAILAANLRRVFELGQSVVFEIDLYNTCGSRRFFQIHAAPEFCPDGAVKTVLSIARDVTDQKQIEKEIARLDRMNLIGEMAASIGHEVRNPMTTVRGFLQMFQIKKEFASYKDCFDLMIEELDRANAIITDFLSLAKNKTVELKPLNLNSIIQGLQPLLQADALRLGHQLAFELGEIPYTLADEKEIRQLILNLMRNGLEAMEDSGVLTIKTMDSDLEVMLIVKDRGKGIPDAMLEKLGTPFLTTKENGIGLGLSVCYRIVERHKAKIEFDTSACGTEVLVRFCKIK